MGCYLKMRIKGFHIPRQILSGSIQTMPLQALRKFPLYFLGICALIGLAIYTDKASGYHKWSRGTFGWSFILGWVGVVFAVISGVFGLLKGRQSSSN